MLEEAPPPVRLIRPHGLLTDIKIQNAKPRSKRYKLYDGNGLFLLISPTGRKWWRFRYRHHGATHILSLGTYPEISLKEARGLRDGSKALLAKGIDPLQHRKLTERANANHQAETFEIIAREWHTHHKPSLRSEKNADLILRRLELHIFPILGNRPIREISAPDLLQATRKIEARGTIETARRTLRVCGQIFRYAVASGRADRDPTPDLRGALKRHKKKHFPAPAAKDPSQLAKILRAINGYEGSLVVHSALRLAPMLFKRPGELRTAQWSHIDLDAATWRAQLSKRQYDEELIVPLPRQAVQILRILQLATGDGLYVFPNVRSKNRPMSDMALNAALRQLGIPKTELVPHSFRAIAKTMLIERLGIRPDIVEHELGHIVRDPQGRAYNRATYLKQRRRMMQRWADYLDRLAGSDNVIPFKSFAAG